MNTTQTKRSVGNKHTIDQQNKILHKKQQQQQNKQERKHNNKQKDTTKTKKTKPNNTCAMNTETTKHKK